MISIDDLNSEIQTLEQQEPSYAGLERLASMYAVRNEMTKGDRKYQPVQLAGSEFLEACSDADIVSVLSILDEHMDAIKLIHPREYMALIQRLNALHSI